MKPPVDAVSSRGRDISDSEIDKLNRLQGVEVVPHKDPP